MYLQNRLRVLTPEIGGFAILETVTLMVVLNDKPHVPEPQ